VQTSHAMVFAKPAGREFHSAWSSWWFGCGCFA
jgi:hypothetical protein